MLIVFFMTRYTNKTFAFYCQIFNPNYVILCFNKTVQFHQKKLNLENVFKDALNIILK